MSARVRAVPVGTIAWNDDRSNIALRHWDQSWRYVFDPPEGQANIADGWEYWEPGYCPARMGGIVNTCGSACFRRPPFQLIRSVPSPPTG